MARCSELVEGGGMGCNPMSTFPRPMPSAGLPGAVVAPSFASSGRFVTRDVSGFLHISDAFARFLASSSHHLSPALEQLAARSAAGERERSQRTAAARSAPHGNYGDNE